MNKELKITFADGTNPQKINEEYYKKTIKEQIIRLSNLKDRIINFNLDNKNYKNKFSKIEIEMNDIIDRVNDLMEVMDDIKNKNIRNMIYRLNSYCIKVQSAFMGLKVNFIQKNMNDLEEKFNKETAQKIEDTEEVSNGHYFNIASVYLGISLVSAMVAGIEFINKDYFLLYFLTIGWIALVVIGFTSILIRRFNKKSVFILAIIAIYTLVLLHFGYKTYDIIERRNNLYNCETEKEQLENQKQLDQIIICNN